MCGKEKDAIDFMDKINSLVEGANKGHGLFLNKKNIECVSEEAALKGLFLGPQAENREWVQSQINSLLNSWFDWRREFRPDDGCAISAKDMVSEDYRKRRTHTENVLNDLASRFESEIPKFSPRYIGHMFSEISLPALFGHILTLLHNPNNISEESSKVGILIEDEAIDQLSEMIGFKHGVGHFTSGGTVANFEAVYRAITRCYNWMSAGLAQGETSIFKSAAMGWETYDAISRDIKERSQSLNPLEGNAFSVAARIQQTTGKEFLGPVMLIPEHKHYSWVKAASVFGLGSEAVWPVLLDGNGHLDVDDLKKKIQRAEQEDRPIALIVSVLGTTELGIVDPIDKVQTLLDSYRKIKKNFLWHHIDAAYGGFMCSLRGAKNTVLSRATEEALEAVAFATSITIDPHKLGYVPFSSGTFIAASKKDYYQRSFGAPYVDFTETRSKGSFTLEGSRSATGAVATWMTARCVGLNPEGYGQIISRTVRLRKEFESRLSAEIPSVKIAPAVDANLLCFCFAHKGESLQAVNARTMRVYQAFGAEKNADFFISKTKLYRKNYAKYFQSFISTWDGEIDCEELLLIRLCIMNPFFQSVEMKVDYQDLFVRSLRGKLGEGYLNASRDI
jgi:glutamate/tyrosine decarboxylase-like PLP-dependent enzyme